MAEPLPEGVAPLLPAAIASMQSRLAPVEPHVLAGLLQRLWDANIPQPEPITIAEWRRLLGQYPATVLASAFDQVAKTHRWPDPPKIADVIKFVGDDMGRLLNWKRKLDKAKLRADIDAKAEAEAERKRRKHQQWRDNLPPEQRATLDQVRERMASGESVASLLAHARAEGAKQFGDRGAA